MKFELEDAVDRAMRVIWRDGYEATSVKSMSEALGITRSSYYNTFGSRERLFEFALTRYMQVIPERALFSDQAEQDFPAMLTALMREVSHFRTVTCPGIGCLAANSLGEVLPADSDAARVLENLSLGFIERLEQLVTGAVERAEMPAETDPNATAMAIHSMIMGLNLQSKIITDQQRLWASVKSTLTGLGLYKD